MNIAADRQATGPTPEDNGFSVIIADPDFVVAETMCQIMRELFSGRVIGVDTLEAAIEAGRNQKIDFLFYDCRLPGCSGLTALTGLLEAFPESAIVLFGQCTDFEFLSAAMMRGLRGYVPKSIPLKSLVPTLELLKAGEAFVPANIFSQIAKEATKAPAREWNVTPMEEQMLMLIESGLRNREIGERIGASEVRVKTKLRALYQKIGATNRMHAIKIAKECSKS